MNDFLPPFVAEMQNRRQALKETKSMMWLFSAFIVSIIVAFTFGAIYFTKKQNLAIKHGGWRKWAWSTASGYVRIDWKSPGITDAFREEYAKNLSGWALTWGVSACVAGLLTLLLVLLNG